MFHFIATKLGINFIDNYSDLILEQATKSGKIDILIWMKKRGYEFDPDLMYTAACHGRTEILKFLFENGCDADESVTSIAAKRGHWACLLFCIEKEFPVDGCLHHYGNKLALMYGPIKYLDSMEAGSDSFIAALDYFNAESVFDNKFPDKVRLALIDRFAS